LNQEDTNNKQINKEIETLITILKKNSQQRKAQNQRDSLQSSTRPLKKNYCSREEDQKKTD
jgi:hypothetical protein